MLSGYEFSRFLRTVECEGLVVVFHQLHPSPTYFCKQNWDQILSGTLPLSSEDVNHLIQQGLLIEDCSADTSELEQYRSLVEKMMNRPSILYFMLAQGCNNTCTYCPIPALALQYGNNLLSLEDAIAGINLWQEHLEDWNDDDPYFLIFYGGEPLLNQAVFEQLLHHIDTQRDHLPSNLELILPTNGLLVDPPLAELLAKHNILVVLGIDGTPSHNDATRRTNEGDPTSATVERVSYLLRDHGVRLAASMTLTPSNVHAADEHRAYFVQLGIKNIGFNVLKGSALKALLGTMSTTEYYHAAAKAVVGGCRLEDMIVQEYQLQKKLDALVAGQPFAVDCTCYGNQLVVQADGTVTNCPFLHVDLGHVQSLSNQFRIAETEVVQSWRQRIPLLNRKESWFAGASFLHGGGCAWGAHELHGDSTKKDDDNELFNSEVMYGLIRKLLPQQAREDLLSGEITYWNHRRFGNL